jgi:hypothetical protein
MPTPSRRRRPTAPLAAAVTVTALAAAAGLAVTAAGTSSAATAQLLSNPSFETGTLSGWSCGTGDAVVTSPVSDGSYALAGTPSASATAQCSQTVQVQPNSSYTLSARVQGPYVYLGATGTGAAADPSTWTSATSWSTLSTTFTTGASTTSITVYVHGWYGQSAFDADAFSLTGPAGSGGTGTTGGTSTTGGTATTGGSTAGSTSGSSGGSTPTPTPTPTQTASPPPANGGFTHPVYFMPLDNSPQSISDIVSGSGEKQFLLAFVLDSGSCTPAWDGDSAHPVSSNTTVLADVNAIRAAGGDVGVSFGGYNGTELGATCGSASALAAAYQQVIDKYKLTRIDLDWEGDDLDAGMAVRWAAIKTLEQKNPGLTVSLTIPMTTVGLPDTGKDEIKQAIAAGARIDVVNIMDFDFGLTGGTETDAAETVAADVNTQLQSLYGWDAATAWAHTSVQLMNGHTDQPSELFTQDTFTALLGWAKSKHVAALSYWDVNRDRACDPSTVHYWADGACSSVTQNPWDFTKIITQYTG